ncbi:uncharacterized protein LOC117924287 [Vitis riparia]|uniref:uncharacterized protein LOC117924287 n=1 Tax=Vitis riparia TaxID=96939 RepID=UPI00155A1EF6|nr:uncharacterized protein LOC117924287 [Vitis riparia]
MGLNQTLKYFCTLVFLVLLFSFFPFSDANSTSPHEIQASTPSNVPTSYQLFYIKNTPPFSLNEEINDKKKKKRRRRKKTTKSFRTRPFSAMLPKGFVPPSGSSPCHNDYPNSIAFYCDLSSQKP